MEVGKLFLIGLTFSALLTTGCVNGQFNLYLNLQEVMRLLGVSAELYYVRGGLINDYALNFVVPVPANIKDIAFTWQSLAGRPLPYNITLTSSNPAVLPRPYLNITQIGEMPQKIQTFSVNMKCSGVRAAEVIITITIQITLNRDTNKITKLIFRRKKICLESSLIDNSLDVNHNNNENNHNNIDDPMLLETIVPPQSGFITLIVGGVLALILVALLIAIAFCARARGSSKRSTNIKNAGQLVKTSSFQHIQGSAQQQTASIYVTPSSCAPTYATLPPPPPPNANTGYHSINNFNYNNTYRIDTEQQFHKRISEVTVEKCRVRLCNLLQEGCYSRLYRGTYNDCQEVLVKTVTQHANQMQISLLLQEGMSLYGASHPGILSVLGVSIEDHTSPFVLYPAPYNTQNLKLFLTEPSSTRSITSIQIVMMSNQLASALGHLHSHGVVHKDIASRNCVIDEQFNVKLGDNSLARDLFPMDYHCVGDTEIRPIKWLAIEALKTRQYSESSDIWAFGVLMWELCTFAKQPYTEVDPIEMEHYLRDGYRLAQPYNCPDELFTIMAYCWAVSPLERPNFTQLQYCLSDFYSQITRYV